MTDREALVRRIEVWSDPQCVWCYIAGPRLDAAIAAHGGTWEVAHRSFQLDPAAPVEVDREAHVRAHSGGMSAAERDRITAHLTALAAAEGLGHRPDLVQPTNSGLALELLHHAATEGLRADLTRRLARAHLAEGRHLGRVDELLDLAGEVGLDRDRAADAVATRTYAEAVRRDTARARALGARGVPFYLVDGTAALGGAVSTEDLVAALRSGEPT